MTPTEILFKLKNLPPNTPITAEHIITLLGALQTPQTISSQPGAYSTWDNEKLIDTETLAEWIGEIPSRLKKWRVDGVGPKFISKSKHVAYRVGDVRDWIQSRTVQSTTQADRLSFCSTFEPCFINPIIYHQEQPYSLFESMEMFSENPELEIDGQVVFLTTSPLPMAYLNQEALTGYLDNIKQAQHYFINGKMHQGTLAHVIAHNPNLANHQAIFKAMEAGLDFNQVDDQGNAATHYLNSELLIYTQRKSFEMKLRGTMTHHETGQQSTKI